MPLFAHRRMARARSAEVIAIGDELLSGETVDTNSGHLDAVLEGHGYLVLRHQAVPDEVEAIAEAVSLAASRASVVVTTGGLGPTRDDLTFEGVARALGVELRHHEGTWARIEALFRTFGRTPTPNNRRQASLPQGAEALDNDVGTAPGLHARLGEAQLFVLPGVPREMRWLFAERVLPRLPAGPPVARRTLKVAGVGESQLEIDVSEAVSKHPEVQVCFRTQVFENHVKLAARGEGAAAKVEAAAIDVRAALAGRVFGEGDATLESTVIAELRSARHTVSAAESCTGGWIGQLLTAVPGSSAAVLGGVIAYAYDAKVSLLGVDRAELEAQGAVSETVARQMAEGVRARLGSTWGLGTTGIAGPGGGTADKPVGTVWCALAGPAGTEAWRLDLGERGRDVVRLATVKSALEHLRLAIRAQATPARASSGQGQAAR